MKRPPVRCLLVLLAILAACATPPSQSLLDLDRRMDAVPSERRAFTAKATVVHTDGSTPFLALQNIDFALVLYRRGSSLTGHFGVQAALAPSPPVVPISGTFIGNAITIQPFQNATSHHGVCLGPRNLAVSSFIATTDWHAGHSIRGSFTGKITYHDLDALPRETPFTASFDGIRDERPPAVELGGSSFLNPAILYFTEPVEAPSGSVATLIDDAGTGLLSVPIVGPVSRVVLAPVGVWPFSQTLAVVLPNGIVDLASNPLPPTRLEFSTMAAPPMFANPGFESDLPGMFSTCPKIVHALGGLKPKQGNGMAYFPNDCLFAQIVGQIDVPKIASSLTIAVDFISDAPTVPYAADTRLLIAGVTGKSEVDIRQLVGAPDKPVTGATAFPLFHTGFVDLHLDVKALAGKPAVLIVGRTIQPGCGPGITLKYGLLVDDMRIQ